MKLPDLTVIKFKKIDLPLIVWMVIGSTFIADTIEFLILGRNISGWAWVVPLIGSIFVISRRPSRISFPVLVWTPWICVVVFYFIDSGFSYPQRNIMLLSPIIVGMAVSAGRISESQLKEFLVIIKCFLYLLFLTVVIRTGMLFTGVLPATTGLAPQSMTAALLCSIFAVEYSINRESNLVRWILGAAIPVIALTRTAIIAAGMTIPFTFASLKIKRRLIFLTIVAALSVTLFYTERVQRKMFYSGAGTLQDVRFSNPDFFTTGRTRLWDLMIEEIKAKPLWGHGANASEEFVFSVTWRSLTHPHNDWLRLLYDYGFIGTSVFAFCLIAQVIHLLKGAKNTFGVSRILLYAGASSFLPFVLLMSTDNIILYAAFFGNLQFTIIGLVCAAQKRQDVDKQHYFRVLPMRPPVNPSEKATGENRHGLNHFPSGRWK
jgi:O-antigen ligase